MVMMRVLLGDTPYRVRARALLKEEVKEVFERPAVMVPEGMATEGLLMRVLLYVALKAILVDDLDVTNWRN
jgi:hypothetical protein